MNQTTRIARGVYARLVSTSSRTHAADNVLLSLLHRTSFQELPVAYTAALPVRLAASLHIAMPGIGEGQNTSRASAAVSRQPRERRVTPRHATPRTTKACGLSFKAVHKDRA